MDPWKPAAGLVAAGIGVVVVGGLATMVGRTLSVATPVTDIGSAALAAGILVVVGVLAVAAIGARDGGSLSTPYW